MLTMQKLPIGVQDFTTLRTENFVYVDKTKYLYDLITRNRIYFLSRPRRFGKSLILSTLEAIFLGRKELFKDLWIENSDYDWKVYPTLRIDMSRVDRISPESFNKSMKGLLLDYAKQYHVTIPREDDSTPDIFTQLINVLAENIGKVVVLIDEYDKPMLDNIDNVELTKKMRDTLRDFYTILKAQDHHLKFVLLTGVTKFSKVSVFSGLNNPQDLTMDDRYATMLGYTQQELETVFEPWIACLTEKNKHSLEQELAEIKHWYNGYQFSPEGQRVYNPFSTLLLFEQQVYRAHWFATGTPTFLLKLIEQQQFDVPDIENMHISEEAFTTYDIDRLDTLSLLFQTGYLTIKHYDPIEKSFELNYPNFEVKRGFTASLLQYTTELTRSTQDNTVFKLRRYLNAQHYDDFFDTLQRFFLAIPYDLHMKGEKYYQNIIYFILTLIGVELKVEVHTHLGRIDAVIELTDKILIFEFKLDQSADIALAQIYDKQYAEPYKSKGKTIELFGVNFNTQKRNIDEWKQEVLTEC